VTRATATTLTSKFDAAMELAADVLRNPSFDDKEVALLKDVAVASIAQAKTNPSSVASRYLEAVLYADHPYGGMPASAADVTALTRDDLRQAYQHRIRPQDLTLYVVGGIEPDLLIETLNRHFGDWKPAKGEALVADIMQRPETGASRVILFDMPGAPQTNIVAAQVVDPPYQEGHTEFDLANMIYGGNFTSRINSNLREEKGWSYGVRSSINNVAGPRTWRITAQVQTDKTADTIRELIGELRAINSDRPFGADELQKVRNERVRKLPAVTASAFGILGYLAENGLHGRADDYIEQRNGEYEAVALEALAPAFDQRVDPDGLTWFISGDLAAIRESVKALELGEIEIWDVDGRRLNQEPD
jgi:zinc protease